MHGNIRLSLHYQPSVLASSLDRLSGGSHSDRRLVRPSEFKGNLCWRAGTGMWVVLSSLRKIINPRRGSVMMRGSHALPSEPSIHWQKSIGMNSARWTMHMDASWVGASPRYEIDCENYYRSHYGTASRTCGRCTLFCLTATRKNA